MIKPVSKTPVYEEIVNQIIVLIKKGKWDPSEQLPSEAELAKAFGVSRNSIREALKYLSMLGVLYAHPGQGTFVTKEALKNVANTELLDIISKKASIPELLETRLVIEPHLSRLAALRATKEDKQKLKAIFQQLENDLSLRISLLSEAEDKFSHEKKENLAVDDSKIRDLKTNPTDVGLSFHMCVAEIARNKVLANFLKSIREELEWQRSWIYFRDYEEIKIMSQDHKNIYEAIIDNNQKEAKIAMYNHLIHVYDNIAEYDKNSTIEELLI